MVQWFTCVESAKWEKKTDCLNAIEKHLENTFSYSHHFKDSGNDESKFQ